MPAYSITDLAIYFSSQSIPKQFTHVDFGMHLRFLAERLFAVVAPFMVAVVRTKKRSSSKAPKRKPYKRSNRNKERLSKSSNARKITRKVRIPTKLRRGQSKTKSAAPPPKGIEEEEPLPPPVPPIGRAILLVPKDSTYVDSLHPTFRWLSVGGATKYQIQWGEDPTLGTQHALVSLATEATIPVEKPLRVAAIYYWRVRGGNDAGWGPWSPISSFHVLEETV
jgi:hypothetical protein